MFLCLRAMEWTEVSVLWLFYSRTMVVNCFLSSLMLLVLWLSRARVAPNLDCKHFIAPYVCCSGYMGDMHSRLFSCGYCAPPTAQCCGKAPINIVHALLVVMKVATLRLIPPCCSTRIPP